MKGVELQAAFLLRISLTSPFFIWLINAGFRVLPCYAWEAKGGAAPVIPPLTLVQPCTNPIKAVEFKHLQDCSE